jgi:hypothetical protein
VAGEFDLFAFLAKLNRRDLLAYDSLSPEQQKNAHPFIVLRWLSGTGDQAQIIRLNEFANRYVFSLGTEKPLLFKLLAAACTGKTQRASWIKGPGSKSEKLAIEAIKTQYECSTREARDYLPLLDAADVVRFAEDAGWEKDAIKKLTTELGKDDTGSGSTTTSRRKPKK